jgi:hypothetical protein
LRRGFLAAASLALLAALSAPPAHAAFPGANGRIAFHDQRPPDPGSTSIFSINPDGSGITPLTTSSLSTDSAPGWSADGATIVYLEQQCCGVRNLRVMNFDGSNNHQVPGVTPNDNLTWSPDGTKIAWDGITVANSNGTGVHGVTTGVQPAWSPSGAKIAYSLTSGGRTDVYTVNPDGTGATNLTSDAASGSTSPDWSPDSSKIVYAQGGGIWTMNADGSGKSIINASGGSPVWSPDSTRIAYTTAGAIHTMDTDGSNDALVSGGSPTGARALDWEACSGTCPDPTFPYDVPGVAQFDYIKFVPTFRQTISDSQCQSRGGTPSTHGPPLSLPSCNPPGYVPGTVAHQGQYGESGVIYQKGNGYGGGGDELNIQGGGTDIRNAANGDYNPSSGLDATLFVKARITDTYNGSSLNVPATVTDFELALRTGCSPDPLPDVGSTCAAGSSTEAIMPGMIRPGRHAVIQLFEVQMKDIGADGILGNADDRSFVFQGVAIP